MAPATQQQPAPVGAVADFRGSTVEDLARWAMGSLDKPLALLAGAVVLGDESHERCDHVNAHLLVERAMNEVGSVRCGIDDGLTRCKRLGAQPVAHLSSADSISPLYDALASLRGARATMAAREEYERDDEFLAINRLIDHAFDSIERSVGIQVGEIPQ